MNDSKRPDKSRSDLFLRADDMSRKIRKPKENTCLFRTTDELYCRMGEGYVGKAAFYIRYTLENYTDIMMRVLNIKNVVHTFENDRLRNDFIEFPKRRN